MDSFGDTPSNIGSVDDAEKNEPWIHKGFETLMRRWRNETFAPEILPFDLQTIEDYTEATELVSEVLHEDRMEAESQDANDPDFNIRCMDHERVQYVMRDYLRQRLWKLQQWPQHYLEMDNIEVLSEAERVFLREIWDAKKVFLQTRLLDALPPAKQALDDNIDIVGMVRRPNLDAHVYARIKDDIPSIEVSPSLSTQGSEPPEPLRLVNGQTYLIRYSLIRNYMVDRELDGKIEQGSEPPEPLRLVNGQTYLIRYSLIRNYMVDRELDGKIELV
jgi:hypothetical protein